MVTTGIVVIMKVEFRKGIVVVTVVSGLRIFSVHQHPAIPDGQNPKNLSA